MLAAKSAEAMSLRMDLLFKLRLKLYVF